MIEREKILTLSEANAPLLWRGAGSEVLLPIVPNVQVSDTTDDAMIYYRRVQKNFKPQAINKTKKAFAYHDNPKPETPNPSRWHNIFIAKQNICYEQSRKQ
jgi:hypothetical protein